MPYSSAAEWTICTRRAVTRVDLALALVLCGELADIRNPEGAGRRALVVEVGSDRLHPRMHTEVPVRQ